MSSIAVLAFASIATGSAWAVAAQPAVANTSVSGTYAAISGSELSIGKQNKSDAGGLIQIDGAQWGVGFAASAEATSGTLKAFASTTYAQGQSNGASSFSNSFAVAKFSDFVTFSGGRGLSEGTFLASLSGMLAGGESGTASSSWGVTLCDTSSETCGHRGSKIQLLASDGHIVNSRSKLAINKEYESGFDFEFGKTYQLDYYLNAVANDGGIADFANNAHLSFDMAKGVALTSSSGYQYGVAAVPEPETYAMMLSGLGFMGFVARSRKAFAKTAHFA